MNRIRTATEMMLLLEAYNQYVQEGCKREKGTGWTPVCVNEFEESENYKNWLGMKNNGPLSNYEALTIVLECAQAGKLSDHEINDEAHLVLVREQEEHAIAKIQSFMQANHALLVMS